MADAVFRVAREFDVVRVRITAEGEERVARLRAEQRCLGCEEPLNGQKVTCGLCQTCYQGARHFIRKGTVSQRDLIRDGKMLPPGKGGQKPANKFTRELAEM